MRRVAESDWRICLITSPAGSSEYWWLQNCMNLGCAYISLSVMLNGLTLGVETTSCGSVSFAPPGGVTSGKPKRPRCCG